MKTKVKYLNGKIVRRNSNYLYKKKYSDSHQLMFRKINNRNYQFREIVNVDDIIFAGHSLPLELVKKRLRNKYNNNFYKVAGFMSGYMQSGEIIVRKDGTVMRKNSQF